MDENIDTKDRRVPPSNNYLDESGSKNKRNNLIIIVLLVLLAVLVFLYFNQRSDFKYFESAMTIERDSLKSELNTMIIGYDSLSLENDTLSHEMMQERDRADSLIKVLDKHRRLSYQEIAKYKKEVGTLRSIMRNFVKQIDSLNAKNEQLMAQVEGLQKDYTAVREEKQQIEQSRDQLQSVVEKASKLKVRGLSASLLNKRGVAVDKRRSAVQILVGFTISGNITAERGEKTAYVRIERPDQIVMLSSPSNVFTYDNSKLLYSMKRDFVYEGKDLSVNLYWDQDVKELPLGTYTIDLFIGGENVASTKLEISK
ncbi:MAG: hypothetical protein ACK5IQ_07300 [Bacteroidales bacterium]